MLRLSATFICCVALLLAGCGGSGGSSSSSTTKSTTGTASTASSSSDHQRKCVLAEEAKDVYETAAGQLGLSFTDKPLVNKALSALEELRARVFDVELTASGTERANLATAVRALSQQGAFFNALIVAGPSAAAKDAEGLNDSIPAAKAAIDAACKH